MRLTKERKRQLSEIYEEIVEYYGESKFQWWTPEFNAYSDDSKRGLWLMGAWEPLDEGAEVSVNVAACRTMKEVVIYIIHEYMHHLQSPTWYTRYHNMYGYWKNPYEIQAQEIAERDVELFWPPGGRPSK